VPGNFGVTSSFWDRFFGTHIVSDKPVAEQVVRSGATWSNSAASSRTDTGNLANPGWRFRCAPMRERE
jgi:sterol desaturase/sphingolipid hydroxylase (fatty acid hydroxylase superfamily)